MDWQPIATAPKDEPIMGWGRYFQYPSPIQWNERNRCWRFCVDGEDVIESETDFGTDYKDAGPVSHWAPMMKPPADAIAALSAERV